MKTIQTSKETLLSWDCDYRVILPAQGEKWLRGSANPERLDDGSTLWHGYISDISELKQHEERLNYTSKLAAMGEMAAGIAHEINNPLFIIKTAAQQGSKSFTREDFDKLKVKDYFEKINLTADRIARIIKGLKFFSRTSTREEYSSELVKTIIDETYAFCFEKFKVNGVELKINIPDDLIEFEFDCHPVEISQVILNLLNNAFDAVEKLDSRWVKLAVEKVNTNLIFSVTDSGNGLRKAEEVKLFTPFYTTKPIGRGTGLGLNIVKGIIENHKGIFWIDYNSPNTKFVFSIPIKHEV
jgi:C4-dicarboxylate-specific signal transduction histidine kinase